MKSLILKISLCIICITTITWESSAQCPTGNIAFFNQAALDSWLVLYPNCTDPEGRLILGGTVSDLSGLSQLTSVAEIRIISSTELTSLAGLDNIGTFTASGSFLALQNTVLESFVGLGSLTNVENIQISGVNELSNLTGLNSLQSLNQINMSGCPNLTNLDGLQNITSVNSLSIRVMENLTSLSGIQNITCNSSLNFEELPQLTNLNNFCNIENQNFNTCFIQNCNSLTDLAGFEVNSVFYGNLLLLNNPNITSVLGIENCDFSEASLNITGSPIQNLSSISIMSSIDALSLNGLQSLTSLSDLINVPINSFSMNNCNLVSNLEGLNNNTEFINFTIISNNNLTDISELINLETVTRRLTIYENNLSSLNGLENLITAGIPQGNISAGLFIEDENNLQNLDDLQSLANIDNLTIRNNDQLQNIDGLSSFSNLTGNIFIGNNNILTNLNGLENVDPVDISQGYGYLRITDNPVLSICNQNIICEIIDEAAANTEYTILIQNNATGCNSEAEVDEACDPCTLPTVTFTALSDICVDGTSETGLSGGNPAGGVYSGSGVIDDGNGMTFTFSSAAAGIGVHTLTYDYTDSNGCQNSASTDIEVLDLPIIAVTPIHTTCNLDNGGATISITSGEGPFTNTLNGTPVTLPLTDLATGFYTILAIDANGCTDSELLNIDPSDPLEVSATPVATTCNLPNGSVSFTTISGTDPVTYTENGQSVSMTDLAAGDHTWDAEDAGGCMSQVSFTIDDSPHLSLGITSNVGTTCGLDNGYFTFNILSGVGPVTFTENGAPADITAISAGFHSYIATDANGCTQGVNRIIDDSVPFEIEADPIATTCDLDNGEVSFVNSTGTSPYTYMDGNTEITDLTGLAAGDYTWEVEDASGCLYEVSFTIDGSIAATFTTTPTHTFCDGNNGSVSATMLTGNGPLTYTLNGQVNNTGTYNSLSSGTYTMTAVDPLFCSASSTFTINGSDPLEITTVVAPTFCNEDNGSITATLDSGTAPVDYTITGQGTNTTGAFTNLAPGTYTLNAEDAVGCEATETFTIAPSDPLTINTAINHTTCELDNGSLTATLTSGIAPVTFTLVGEGTNSTGLFVDLAPGSYTMNAVDAIGCQSTLTFNINDSELPSMTLESAGPSCGEDNGEINFYPTGGIAPYQVNIGQGWGSMLSITNLATGVYTVQLRDADGCTIEEIVEFGPTDKVDYLQHIDDSDCGQLTGVVTLIATSGIEPLTYVLENEFITFKNSTGIFANLESGIYNASVIGDDLCTVTQEITVNESPAVQLAYKVTHPECGETNGHIEFDFTLTGTSPFELIMDGQLIEDSLYSEYLIADLGNGNYKLEVVDFYGCTDYAEITIDDGYSIMSDIIVHDVDCEGTLGSINTIISGNGAYTFSMDSVMNETGDFSNLMAGTYSYYATDSMGCDLLVDVVISDNSFKSIRPQIRITDCGDMFDLRIYNIGGQEPFAYYVNGEFHSSNHISNLGVGEYELKVVDSNDCGVVQPLVVEGNNMLAFETIRCQLSTKSEPGFVKLDAIGGVGPYLYQLGPYYNTHGIFVNLLDEAYPLTITDDRGCLLETTITLCPHSDDMKISARGQDSSEYKVFPNPASSDITLSYSSHSTSATVYNSLGHKVMTRQLPVLSNSLRIEISHLSNGVYYVTFDKHNEVFKLIKI